MSIKLNYKIIFHFFGLLLICNGGFMFLTSLVSLLYNEACFSNLVFGSLGILLVGVLSMYFTKGYNKQLNKREGYLIVTFGWIIMTLSGTIPYIVSGAIPAFTDAVFETMSGYTTTGASIVNDIEALPKGILLWRSITHWIGGMGIIVLAIAILPLLGIGGMQLFVAEAPGIAGDKLHPRIKDTAKQLWLIYVGYTLLETLLLKWAGMSFFDAINHSLSTLSTGGFSTKNESLAYWNHQPIIQYIVMLFMLLAGTNFVLSYFAFKGKIQKILQDDEFKFFIGVVFVSTLIVSIVVYFNVSFENSSFSHHLIWGKAEGAFRHSLFQILAIITTTGFATADYILWTPLVVVFFFGLMFLGGSAGSTAGGVKIVRHLILIKNGFLEFRRAFHPNAILPVRYNNKTLKQELVYNVLAFFILYMLLFILGALVFSVFELDFESSIGLAASSLGNIGPALGDFGPTNNYASLPILAKWWSAFLMLVGRLELFTVLIILTPFFWRNR